MHEFSTAQRLLEVALKVAEEKKASKIIELELEIGGLTHLNGEQLTFSFQILSEGTIAEGAQIKVRYSPVKFECKKCGYISSRKIKRLENIMKLNCSKCSSKEFEFIGGKTCILKSIKIKN